jgi:hypothetical protein
MNFSVKSAKGTVLYDSAYQLSKGLNYISYRLWIDPEQLKTYQKEIEKSGDKNTKLAAAKDGNIYLRQGRFTFDFQKGDALIGRPFEIKPPKEKPERKPEKKTP